MAAVSGAQDTRWHWASCSRRSYWRLAPVAFSPEWNSHLTVKFTDSGSGGICCRVESAELVAIGLFYLPFASCFFWLQSLTAFFCFCQLWSLIIFKYISFLWLIWPCHEPTAYKCRFFSAVLMLILHLFVALFCICFTHFVFISLIDFPKRNVTSHFIQTLWSRGLGSVTSRPV